MKIVITLETRWWRWMVSTFGVACMLFSLAVAWFWLYWIAPLRHVLDPTWRQMHSPRGYQEELQTHHARTGWLPDMHCEFFSGDHDTCGWLIAHLKPHVSDDCCDGHPRTALALMTNQESTNWPGWWQANKNKTQAAWLRDGFKAYGVEVQLPPSPADALPLLNLLGATTTNETGNLRISWPVSYNAYRWLRDSGFSAVGFALSNRTLHASAQLQRGLLAFESWHKQDAAQEADPLPFAQTDGSSRPLPGLLQPQTRWLVWSLMVFPFVSGVLMLLRVRRHANNPFKT